MTNDFDNTQADQKQPKRLHRIKARQIDSGRELLQLASLLLEADERTQKQTFKSCMPAIYTLVNHHKFTFKRITLLLSQIDLKLTESSVRVYYNQFLTQNTDHYINFMNEHIRQESELKKGT